MDIQQNGKTVRLYSFPIVSCLLYQTQEEMKQTEQLKITFVGTIDLNSLPESERKTFYNTLLARIQELYQNSKVDENGI